MRQQNVRLAPGVARRATPAAAGSREGARSAEVTKAREDFEKSGYSDEGLEQYVNAKLAGANRGRGKEPALA